MSEGFNLPSISVLRITALLALYFKSIAACCAILIGLSTSLVLSTLPNPTFDALIPDAILLLVIAPSKILLFVIAFAEIVGKSDVPLKSPASFNFPFVVGSASTTPLEVAPSIYVFIAFTEGYLDSDKASAAISFDLFNSVSFKLILFDKKLVSRLIRSLNIAEVSEIFNLFSKLVLISEVLAFKPNAVMVANPLKS